MITRQSTLRQVYQTPVGRDIIDTLLTRTGKSRALLDNPLTANMTLAALDKLAGSRAPGLVDALVSLLQRADAAPPKSPPTVAQKWWKEAVVYQIYPRSFQDSNGDGIGDLAGIRSRIPYLKDLGVDVVWLSPIYDSPNDDMGYDVRDYRKIMKEFGTMRDFNSLLADLHKNGIKLLMDLVVNHTSDEHEWFQKALADPTGPYKEYYMWAQGRGCREPNNWESIFGGPAWNYYPELDEWALHLFSKKQMDLNWNNPAVRAEVYDIVRFWLDKGVDGFRLDVINMISKDGLADGNEALGKAVGTLGIEHYFYGPHLHEYLKELHDNALADYDTFTVGEVGGWGLEMSRLATAEGRDELDMVFNFDHLDNPGESRAAAYRYDLRHLKPYFLKWQQNYGNNCWPALLFENHDNPRMLSKVNPNPAYRQVIAKLLLTLQLTLKGTPFLYQGQELGMSNSVFDSVEDLRDVEALNRYRALLPQKDAADALRQVAWGTRDHARTPMQWDASANAGFTGGEPWIAVNPNYCDINAEAEAANPDSVLNYTKQLIALRRAGDTLTYGVFHPVFVREKETFCYFRIGRGEKYYVEVNLTGKEQKRPGRLTSSHKYVMGNYGGTSGHLRPYEANVYKV